MGDLTLGTAFGYSSSERLVVVSSFYLDKNEVTVAQLRASGLSTFMKVIGHGLNAECTYSDKPADRESLPVNCITRPGAEAYCALKGGRLPTEAEMELAASGRRSVYAPWGDDLASCPDAVFGRTYDANAAAGSKACLATGQGPMPVGSGAWDRLVLSGGDIVDLGGNLTEWTSDEWAQEGSDCWTGPLLYNPHCTKGDSPPGYSVRGASYAHPASQLRAAIRARVDADGGPLSSQIGFRCVRDM
jgi:formylglycine-generating enzyme required for sulfatase activity